MDPTTTLLLAKQPPSLKQEQDSPHETEIQVDDVLIGRELGNGEFGKVYEANWVSKKHLVAVKIVEVCPDRKCNVQVFLGLNHPNLLRNFGIIRTTSWIIMELSPHGNLLQYLMNKNDQLTSNTRHSWIYDLIYGIIFLHENGVIHRNLKSSNCFIFDSCLKISDGLTNQRSFNNTDEYLDSNVPWMAPEVLGDPTRTSIMSDIYSIGIVVNEILSGKIPYGDYTKTKRQLMRKIIHDDLRPTIHKKCGSELMKLLTETWSKDSRLRPTATAFLRLYQRCYLTSPTHAKDIRISSVAKRLFLDTKDSGYNIKCLHILPSGYPVISCMRQTPDYVLHTKLLVFKSDSETMTLHESSSDSNDQQVHICTSFATNSVIFALCYEIGTKEYTLMKFDIRGKSIGKVNLEGLSQKLDTLHYHGITCDRSGFIYIITCQAKQPKHGFLKFSCVGEPCGEITLDSITSPNWVDIKNNILWVAKHQGTCNHKGNNVIGAFDLEGQPLASLINPYLVCKYEPFLKSFCLAISPNGFLIVSDYSGTRFVLNYQGNVVYDDIRASSNVMYGNMELIGKRYLVQQTWNKQGYPDVIQYYTLLADYKFS
ncbi:serine/threonine-protein kinase PLK4-like [Anneissia japonica]|uniref:serine/threonine-protein kinase PLK4-like n=1 Tax=Anneissia japonica TaxID=1529436 RepID=UPI001425B412|nr:serine/threonine-protein kinase PLK4-like [Anneissia japonica]